MGGAGVLPRRFPVALKALPEPWRERICDDVGHGVNKYIIAAARDGTNKDLILTCEWFATRPEYFDGLNADRATKKLGGRISGRLVSFEQTQHSSSARNAPCVVLT